MEYRKKIYNLEQNLPKLIDIIHNRGRVSLQSFITPITNKHSYRLSRSCHKNILNEKPIQLCTIITPGSNDSHGILVLPYIREKIISIFDPSGQKDMNININNNTNTDTNKDANINIKNNKLIGEHVNGFKICYNITPKNTWNKTENCALWCLIMAIFFAEFKEMTFEKIERMTMMHKFYTEINKNPDGWITHIKQYVVGNRGDFDTITETQEFVKHIKTEIQKIIKN